MLREKEERWPLRLSPIFGTILLIAVAIMLVAALAFISMGLVKRETSRIIATPIFVDLSIENFSLGQSAGTFVVIRFMNGENLKDAFENKNGKIGLRNLEVRVDGRRPLNVMLNGSPEFSGSSFTAGDILQVEIPKPLGVGSVIQVIWIPSRQTLKYVALKFP
jgi:flagellin-like protein